MMNCWSWVFVLSGKDSLALLYGMAVYTVWFILVQYPFNPCIFNALAAHGVVNGRTCLRYLLLNERRRLSRPYSHLNWSQAVTPVTTPCPFRILSKQPGPKALNPAEESLDHLRQKWIYAEFSSRRLGQDSFCVRCKYAMLTGLNETKRD